MKKSKRSAEPDPIDPEVVRVAVADGLLIARSAATIGVANRIIMRALREQEPFDRGETSAAARDELGRLASEQEELAERMIDTRSRALKSRGRSKHQFDYRPDDNSALALRQTIYSTIGTELRALTEDEGYIFDIVTSARDRAWNDIGSAVVSQVSAAEVKPDGDYDSLRDERIRQLLDVDLAGLLNSGGDPA
ncbi:hypothetical protein [Frondihabitans cladoniiphilus]|uniref:Asparagine synthase n=1 Tax=Frondihabitans cladoniiphilus TaxID=715785 RepID=A0ABP8W761_9MICO